LVCADTSFLVDIERQNDEALKKLRELADRGEVIFMTSVSVAECYRGAYGSRDGAKALKDTKELLELFAVLSLDYESAKTWGELSESMKSGSIGDRDLFIASIALVNEQSLLTRNKKHFERVPGLVVESW
jgi:tRNA(fMet)-specific endonuclease VapC